MEPDTTTTFKGSSLPSHYTLFHSPNPSQATLRNDDSGIGVMLSKNHERGRLGLHQKYKFDRRGNWLTEYYNA